MEPKKLPQIASVVFQKKNKAGGIKTPDIKLYHKATVITSWYCHKNRHTHQRKRTDCQGRNPRLYKQLIFDKGGKNIQWSNDSLFNT